MDQRLPSQEGFGTLFSTFLFSEMDKHFHSYSFASVFSIYLEQ